MPFFCCFNSSSTSLPPSNLSTPQLKYSSLRAAAHNLTKIFEDLKCPVCFNVCVPPIHNCINGHIICNSCRQKGSMTSCPTCRESLAAGARNIFAENFVLNYAQQCRYASQGCEHLRLKGCNMKPHEDKCMFRPIKCIVGTCGLSIPYKNFLGHVDCAHKASGSDKLPTQVQFKYNPKVDHCGRKMKWLPFYIHAFDHVYYVMMERIRDNFWIWVYSQLSKEADDLEYSYIAYIKLKHPERKISQSWHGPVYPIRTPVKTIIDEGCCFMLPCQVMKNFGVQGIINLTVDIRETPRLSLKGVKNPGDGDSETAVASSSLPAEYNRPPSFYEPQSSPDMPPPPPTQDYDSQSTQPETPGVHFDENGNIFSSTKPVVECAAQNGIIIVRKPRMRRTAAIGIPSFNSEPSQTNTVTSLLDAIPPPADVLNVTSADEDDGIFGDKIGSYQFENDIIDKLYACPTKSNLNLQ